MTTRTEWRALIKWARETWPELKLRVLTVRYSNQLGTCRKSGGRFVIRIANHLNDMEAGVVFVHELAHALTWDTDDDPSDHGPEFGVAYARVYRKYLEWLNS